MCAVFVSNDKDRLANWLTNKKILNELLVTFDIHFKACGQSFQSLVRDPMLEFIFLFNRQSLDQNIFSLLLQCPLRKFSRGSWSSPKLYFLLHLGVSVFYPDFNKVIPMRKNEPCNCITFSNYYNYYIYYGSLQLIK